MADPHVSEVMVVAGRDVYVEVNGRRYWTICPGVRADALLGFRYLHLDESLLIQDNFSPFLPGAVTFLGAPVPEAVGGYAHALLTGGHTARFPDTQE